MRRLATALAVAIAAARASAAPITSTESGGVGIAVSDSGEMVVVSAAALEGTFRCALHPQPNASATPLGAVVPCRSARSIAAASAMASTASREVPVRSSSSARFTSSAAAESPSGRFERDGPFWVQTDSGFVSVPERGALRLSSIGPVRLLGDDGNNVRFTLTKRVRAHSEAEARRLLQGFVVNWSTKGDEAMIEVRHAGERGQAADLSVKAPHRLVRVAIETHGGDVEASAFDGAVKAATGGGRMKVDRIGGAVEATTAGGEIEIGTIGGGVKCLSAGGSIHAGSIGGDASFETGGGEIQVRSVAGATRAVTAGGGIAIGRAASTVTANTAGGAIQVEAARGAVKAETLGGSIQIGGADGVRCETGGGGIRLNDVYGSLRAATAVGNVFARLASGRALTDSYLATHAGDITVLIPASLALTIRAENDRGTGPRSIVSEFPEVATRGEGPLTVAEGKINGGGPLLRLSGMGGTIYIKKQKQE